MYFEGEASKNYLADFFHKRGEEVNYLQIRYFFFQKKILKGRGGTTHSAFHFFNHWNKYLIFTFSTF